MPGPYYVMHDGRALTNYKPSAQLDQEMKVLNNIVSQEQYLQFLKQKGDKIREENSKFGFICYCKNCFLQKNKF